MTKLPSRITESWLKRQGACADGWKAKFRALWPKGAPVTLEAALQAHAEGLDVLWVGTRLLPAEDMEPFCIYTLTLAQPHLVKIAAKLGLAKDAEAIKALDWSDMGQAVQ